MRMRGGDEGKAWGMRVGVVGRGSKDRGSSEAVEVSGGSAGVRERRVANVNDTMSMEHPPLPDTHIRQREKEQQHPWCPAVHHGCCFLRAAAAVVQESPRRPSAPDGGGATGLGEDSGGGEGRVWGAGVPSRDRPRSSSATPAPPRRHGRTRPRPAARPRHPRRGRRVGQGMGAAPRPAAPAPPIGGGHTNGATPRASQPPERSAAGGDST